MSPTLPERDGVENASGTTVQEPKMLLTPPTAEKRQSLAEMMEKSKIKSKLPPGSFTYLSPEYRKQQARNGLDSYTEQLDKVMRDFPDTTEANIAEALKQELVDHFEDKTKGLETVQRKVEKSEKNQENIRQEILSGKLVPSRFVGMEIKKPEVAAVIKDTLSKITAIPDGKTAEEIEEDNRVIEESKQNIFKQLELDSSEATNEPDYSAVEAVAEKAFSSQVRQNNVAPAASDTQVGAALQNAIAASNEQGKTFTPASSASSALRPATPPVAQVKGAGAVQAPSQPIAAAQPTLAVSKEVQEERNKNILRYNLTPEGYFKQFASVPAPQSEDLPVAKPLRPGQKMKLQDKDTYAVNTWEVKSVKPVIFFDPENPSNIQSGPSATIQNLDNPTQIEHVHPKELEEIGQTNRYYQDKFKDMPQAAEEGGKDKTPAATEPHTGETPSENRGLASEAGIPDPALEDLPNLPLMFVGQKIKLEDIATSEVATWEIKSIDKGMVTLFNIDKKTDERTLSTSALKEIWRTNEYYKDKLRSAPRTPAPSDRKPLDEDDASREWADYRANLTSEEEKGDIERKRAQKAFAIDGVELVPGKTFTLKSGVLDEYLGTWEIVSFDEGRGLVNVKRDDGKVATLSSSVVKKAAYRKNPPKTIDTQPQVPEEVSEASKGERLAAIQDMMDQTRRQAEAEEFQRQEALRRPPATPAIGTPAQDPGEQAEEHTGSPEQAPASPENWKERALGRIKNIMGYREGRLEPNWKTYAAALVVTTAALVGGAKILKHEDGASSPSVTATAVGQEPTAKTPDIPWTAGILESEKSGGIKDIALRVVEDIKLSPEDIMKKYAPSYFANSSDPARVKLALGMFGNIVQNDNMGNSYNLSDDERRELSNLRSALDLVSSAASNEPLKTHTTFEQEIMEVKQKVAQKQN